MGEEENMVTKEMEPTRKKYMYTLLEWTNRYGEGGRKMARLVLSNPIQKGHGM